MRPVFFTISFLALAACNFSGDQHNNSEKGRTTQQSYKAGDFENIVLAGSPTVIVTTGKAASVRAEGDAETIAKLEIKVENGTLRIGTKKSEQWHIGFQHRAKVTIYVTTPRLTAATIAGSGDMRIDKVEGDSFAATIAGSGDMDVASLKLGTADISIAGSGDIKAAGAATALNISIAGSGSANLADVESHQAKISIVGSGDVQAKVTETADISTIGSGDTNIAGGAKCTVSKLGSGEVNCN